MSPSPNFQILKRIAENYHKDLFLLAFRIIGNHEDAEDVVQDSYRKMLTKEREISLIDIKEPLPYMKKVVRRQSIDFIKSRKTKWIRNDQLSLEIHSGLDISFEFETIAEFNESQKIISVIHERLINLLNLSCNQAKVAPYVLDGFSNDRIAKETGISQEDVRRLRRSLREKMRRLAKQKGRITKLNELYDKT